MWYISTKMFNKQNKVLNTIALIVNCENETDRGLEEQAYITQIYPCMTLYI